MGMPVVDLLSHDLASLLKLYPDKEPACLT
jgi:hypothetical protein